MLGKHLLQRNSCWQTFNNGGEGDIAGRPEFRTQKVKKIQKTAEKVGEKGRGWRKVSKKLFAPPWTLLVEGFPQKVGKKGLRSGEKKAIHKEKKARLMQINAGNPWGDRSVAAGREIPKKII